MNPLMSSTTTLCNAPKEWSAEPADHHAAFERACFYLAPVEAGLHGFSLLQGDVGLDLQLYLEAFRLALELAAVFVPVLFVPGIGPRTRQGTQHRPLHGPGPWPSDLNSPRDFGQHCGEDLVAPKVFCASQLTSRDADARWLCNLARRAIAACRELGGAAGTAPSGKAGCPKPRTVWLVGLLGHQWLGGCQSSLVPHGPFAASPVAASHVVVPPPLGLGYRRRCLKSPC